MQYTRITFIIIDILKEQPFDICGEKVGMKGIWNKQVAVLDKKKSDSNMYRKKI